MTRKQMSDQVKFWLGLQDISGFDESGFVYDQLYQGTLDLLARSKCVARCVNLHVTAGTDTYKLDHSVLALVDVEDGARRRARRDEVSSTAFDPTFTLVRADILRVQPTPDADADLQTWAVIRPNKMVADTDSPGDDAYGGIPDEYQDAIVTYALWKCADYADDASAQQGERYRALYEGQDGRGGRLAQIRVSVNKRGTARAARRKVRAPAVAARGGWVG
jgi:hypothetical protein